MSLAVSCLTYDETGVRRHDVDGNAVRTINLRTYGWATEYIYGSSQEHVVAVRKAAKREPTAVARPHEVYSPVLLERDPSDDSLAQENRRRGWSPYINHKGAAHDYVAIGIDGHPTDQLVRVAHLNRRRAGG